MSSDDQASVPTWYLRALSIFAAQLRSGDCWTVLLRLAEYRWGPYGAAEVEPWPLGRANDRETWDTLAALGLVRLTRRSRKIASVELVTDYRQWVWPDALIARRDAEIADLTHDTTSRLAVDICLLARKAAGRPGDPVVQTTRRYQEWRALIEDHLQRFPEQVWRDAMAGLGRIPPDTRQVLLTGRPAAVIPHVAELAMLGRAARILE